MKKLLFLFAVLLTSVGAWGFSLPYNQANWNVFWKSAAEESLNESLTHTSCTGSVYFHESDIYLTGTGTVNITFDYTSGTKKIVVLGVELIDQNDGDVLYSTYHVGESGSIDSNNTYALEVTEAERKQCKIRYYVCHEPSDHALNLTTGQIHVTGPIDEVPIETEDLSTEYYYTITNVSHSHFLSAALDKALALPDNKIAYQPKGLWALERDESTGSYKLRNAMYNNYLGHAEKDGNAWPMKNLQEATNFFLNVEVAEVESHPAYYTICYNKDANHGYAHDANWGEAYSWKQIVGWEKTASPSQWIMSKTDIPTSTRYEAVSFTYSFVYNGVEKFTQSCEAVVGFSYPDITVSFPLGISATKPAEKVTSEINGTKVTVQLSENVPFEYYSNYKEIQRWYYLKFDAGKNYFLYHQDGADHIALDRQELKIDDLESHSWAFVGNPFDGYKIYNKATGENKILSSSTTMSGSEGGGTYPVLTSTPVPNGNNELWYATPSGHATNGFFLGQKGYASNRLNNRDYKKDNDSPTEYRLAYWTGGVGSGSTFVVENAIPVRLTTDDNNPICYALKTGRDWDSKEWWYNYDTDGKISLTQFDGSDAQWWYFKGMNIDKKLCVQLVPKSDNTKFMSYEGSGNGAEKIIAKPDETTGYTNTWRFAFKGGRYVLQTSDGSNYLSNNGGRNEENKYINKMGLWSGSPESDSGTALYIYETMPFELRDNAENEYAGTFLYQLESLANPTFTGSHALALSNIQRGETFTADVDFGFPVSKLDGTADISVLISGWRGTKAEGYFKYYVYGSNVKVTSVSPTSANVRNFEWSIYPHLAGSDFTFTIKNIGTGKYIQTNAEDEATVAGTVTVGEKATATYFNWEADNRFKIVGKNLRLSVTSSSGDGQDLAVDEGHGGCNTWITNTIDYVNNWKTQNIAVFGYVGAYPATLQNEINAVESYSDIPTFESEHAEYIIPITEGYYYIKSVDLSKFAVNDNNGFRATTDPASEKSANNIFRLVSNGDGKYKFQSFANGKYVTLRNADTSPTSSPSEIDEIFANGSSFSFEGSDFAQFKIKDENDKVMRHEGSNNSYAINYWSSDVKYWYLIQAPELPLTIHSTGYSTFSAAVGVDVPEDVTAYYAKEQVGDSHIRMYPVTTIPANEGVVIKGTGGTTVKFPIISNAEALPAKNLLKAHLNTEDVTPGSDNSVFIMATKNDVTGFYPLSTTNKTIGGHKSYLEIPSTSAARLSIIWDDTETGVFEVEGGEQNAEIYDLTGRRLDKPAKGVNVIGGKLVIK